MMPKLDGFSLLKEIRRQNIKTPVIMLTAKSQLDDKLEGLDNGADDYLTKPFASAELLARLRALIRRGQDKETTSYNYKGLSLNPLTFRLSCKGKEETLCAKEYQIMEALIIHPESIISQDKLLMHVYGYDDGDITTLWVYISYLRKNLRVWELILQLNQLEMPVILWRKVMIKKLQRKFILITVTILFVVFMAVVIVMNSVNYVSMIGNLSHKIDMVLEDNGRPQNHGEAPFSARYFKVIIENDNASVDLRHVATISEEDALLAYQTVRKDKGFYNSYYYKK